MSRPIESVSVTEAATMTGLKPLTVQGYCYALIFESAPKAHGCENRVTLRSVQAFIKRRALPLWKRTLHTPRNRKIAARYFAQKRKEENAYADV